jgi:hypothetical protein
MSGCQGRPLASFTLVEFRERKNRTMTKSLETVKEVLRNDKHPFRKADSQPKKAQKNRYERRKIKEFLYLTDWFAEEAV